MGGAVALLLHRKKPEFWDGAVLVAPMCKIADEMRPHPVVISILTKLCRVIPTWKIVPTQDVIDTAIKNPERRMEIKISTLYMEAKRVYEGKVLTDKKQQAFFLAVIIMTTLSSCQPWVYTWSKGRQEANFLQ